MRTETTGCIDALYRALILRQCKLVAWGATGDARYTVAQFPLSPAYFVDTNPTRQGTWLSGIPVLSPEILGGEPPERTVVMIFPREPKTAQAIADQILAIGPFPILPAFRRECDGPVLLQALNAVDGETAAPYRPLSLTVAEGLGRVLSSAAPPPSGRPGHVSLVTELLTLGGSERQICRLAAGFSLSGWQTTLTVLGPPRPHSEGLEHLLRNAGVTLLRLSQPRAEWFRTPDLCPPGMNMDQMVELLRQIPAELAHSILALCQSLAQQQPELVVAYMERAGVVAGIAGIVMGVPRILISLRSLDPGHFQHYFPHGIDWYADCLRLLLQWPSVRIIANSQAGAVACAAWIGMPSGQLGVVANAIPSPGEREAAKSAAVSIRDRLRIGHDQPLLVGVFRLVEEKRPKLFLDILAALRLRCPTIQAVVVGDGPLRSVLEEQSAALRLKDVVQFVGGQSDALPYIAAADILLHTAAFEGLPNVHLEAQSLAKPVVGFRVGGVGESLAPCLHPYNPDDGAIDDLLDAAESLLRNRRLADALGREAATWVERHFGSDRMVRESCRAVGLAGENP